MAASVERRRVLVAGATGQQGGAVVKALSQFGSGSCDFQILALTRNVSSAAAKSLASIPGVELIAGDLNHASEIFEQAGGSGSVWGVFSVQVPDMKHDAASPDNSEYNTGINLIEASLEYGVQHFVQTSVDRGGANSDTTPTEVPHFITKHRIEEHLKDRSKGSNMTYTILRPVAFMDGIKPTFAGQVFGAMLGKLGDKPLQFVATKDIGIFAAQALAFPETDEYKNKAISLAGDELTQQGCNEAFWKALHRPMPTGFGWVGSFFMWMIPDISKMFEFFKDPGYGADIAHCRKLNSGMLDFAAYLKEESGFKQG